MYSRQLNRNRHTRRIRRKPQKVANHITKDNRSTAEGCKPWDRCLSFRTGVRLKNQNNEGCILVHFKPDPEAPQCIFCFITDIA
jgi:hypothetical protein